MPAAMNIQPRKAASITGMLRHDFREYAPDTFPDHVDPNRTRNNQLLQGSRQALDNLPTRQPDRKDQEGRLQRGRKIRSDANVAGSIVLTLPKELDPEDGTQVKTWTRKTLQFLREKMPGQLAYAVLHLDETRPHIHAAVVPLDQRGHLSWKQHFNRRTFQQLQNAYTQALQPLGVEPTPEAEKAVRAAGYTQGIHGWRAGRAVLDAQERVREAERRLEALVPEMPGPVTGVSWRQARKEHLQMQRELARAQAVIAALRRDVAALKQAAQQAREKLQRQTVALQAQLDQLAQTLLDRTPAQERPALAQHLDQAGIQARPVQTILWTQRWERRRDRDQSQDLGL